MIVSNVSSIEKRLRNRRQYLKLRIVHEVEGQTRGYVPGSDRLIECWGIPEHVTKVENRRNIPTSDVLVEHRIVSKPNKK